MSRNSFTSYGGCDIYLTNIEKKACWDLLAITWNDSRFIRGSFSVQEILEAYEDPGEIVINYIDGDCHTKRIVFENTIISDEPDGDVWTFTASNIVNYAWENGEWNREE